ncbi:PREDICTED: uncharacterized protein LOC105154670 [Acromyrmex echinatior]|uniref:uncharacterized protein LOC105154670 n=1 Tax=Acromyrmex echinatior TaxID=103372 RepID=UPI000580ED57|nr:PREDICTED: uncharacterized protein LOC105154670 [Acromyrmex echinatior]
MDNCLIFEEKRSSLDCTYYDSNNCHPTEVILRNAGWDAQTIATGYFNFCVPLYVLLGFCEDYKRIVINAHHELILMQARNDNNCLTEDPATEPTLELFKIQWRMPHMLLSEINKLSMLRALESGRYLSMAFRLWDLYEFLFLQSTTEHSRFDDCKLTNAKLYLNSECYPYDDLNQDFDKSRCAILYDLYVRFCKIYYGYEYLKPSLIFTTFLRDGPFVIIDCSRQNESIKSGTIDVQLDFECKKNVPANTAYCLIIHNRVVQYNPLTNVMRKIT